MYAPCLTPWIPACAGMTKTTRPVIPGEHRETRKPSVFAGMADGIMLSFLPPRLA